MRRKSSGIRFEERQTGIAVAGLTCILCVLAAVSCVRDMAPSRYGEAALAIRNAGLKEEGAFEYLRRITSVGPRLTGSPQAAAAVELTKAMMTEMGLDVVHAEPLTVGHWVRGEREEAKMIGSAATGRPSIPLSVCALGGSVGTPESGITAPVVEVRSFEELERLGPAVRGKIVFFNRPMDRTQTEPFAAYGGAADQRASGAIRAGQLGAVAALVRSLTFRVDDFPHAGLMSYSPGVPRIPAAAISTSGAEILNRSLSGEGTVSVFLRLGCRTLPPVESANVVGELTGTAFPKEIILVGGHLDSWDLGTGAHDDGAGCAASLEALRLLKQAGLRPRRTIRAVLFMDEEFGGTGGRFYARADRRKGEIHLVAMESDRGGYLPVGIAAGRLNSSFLRRIRAWNGLFQPLGVMSFRPGGGGVDVGPLIDQGALPAAVITNAQPYFDVHHSALDVLSSVHPRELELQAVILATVAYIVAQEGI